ncbi:MAG: quinone-dependent dihydroorotate dehydrogenase [Pseudomonadota bacterium]|nr:quinone-dependent dihydroorotate dehydrogenase [Pseudomonadota bacterium]
MLNFYDSLRPLLFRIDAETAHRLTVRALSNGLVRAVLSASDRGVPVDLAGLALPNPVGLAAGLDKDAEAVDGLLALGFGFVEVGAVTPKPQPGNPKPRVFRLAEDRAIINRFGFNSAGVDVVARNLERRRRKGVVGVNLGANKESSDRTADYATCLGVLGRMVDFATVNVSSPNTPGLRELQGRKALSSIFERLNRVRATERLSLPLFLKVAPDLEEDDIAELAAAVIDLDIAALIVSNTTLARPSSLKSRHASQTGGLSGAPLLGPSNAVLARFRQLTDGKVPLIGVGGILSGADAASKIEAGASAVQIYSGLVYRGPALIREAIAATGRALA